MADNFEALDFPPKLSSDVDLSSIAIERYKIKPPVSQHIFESLCDIDGRISSSYELKKMIFHG